MLKREQINKALFNWLPINVQERLGMLRRYSIFGTRGTGTHIIARVDGQSFHGGLCDRWKGIVSLYAFCKATRRSFRLHYTFPFNLRDFQVPNQYDWNINDTDICHSWLHCKMLRLVGDSTLTRMLHLPQDRQIHCYANRDWIQIINTTYHTQYQWGKLFQELFRPSPLLTQALTSFEQWTTHPYMAVAFRMQNLLGDYPEYQYQPTSPERQEAIIQRCLDFLQHLHDEHTGNILVTSDSQRMCEYASQLPFVFTNNAQAAHVDTVKDAPQNEYLKSFVDFYLLAGATKVYCAGTEEMYASDFPKYAAMVHAIPFERITL